MKKTLLACSLIVSSCFFTYAIDLGGGVNLNVGKVCGTLNGKPACINPSTGQMEISDGKGGGIQYNSQTGQVGIGGTLNGFKFGVGATIGGSSTGQTSGVANQNLRGLSNLLAIAQDLASRSVPFLITLAVLAFFWYLIVFIWKGNDSAERRQEGVKGMGYAILAIFIMVSIWGIIYFIGSILGIGQGGGMHGFKLPGEQ